MVPPHFCLQKEKVGFKEDYHLINGSKEQLKQIYDKIELGEEVKNMEIGSA